MTDQGYRVFWDEPEEHSGKRQTCHRDFTTKLGATAFMTKLRPEYNPRVHERPHTTDAEMDAVGRDMTDVLNRRRLVELMLEHNIIIPARDFDKWRPTVEKTGTIQGVADGLMCIATDGLQGYFLREGRQPLIGHVQWFHWDEPDISYVPYIDEHGQEKFFKQVISSGAPSAYYKRPKKLRPPRERKPRSRKPRKSVPITAPAALDLIARMTAEMNNGA